MALLLAVKAGAVATQTGDAPITIEADRAEVSQRGGESSYTGNVVLTRSPTTLRGDELTVTRADDGTVHAELVGDPARIAREPKAGERVTGHAQRVIYSAADETLELVGDAYLERGGDSVRGQTIRHNLATARTEAGRGEGEDERVRITIQPQSAGASDGKDEP